MNNIMFLIKLYNGKDSTLNKLNDEIKSYFKERNYEIIDNKSEYYMVFNFNNKKFIVEYRCLNNTNKYIYNIFFDFKFNKRDFIKEIFLSENVIDCIMIFDTSSNRLLNNNFKELSKLENLLKHFLVTRISDIQGQCVFQIISEFIVKEYIGEKYKKMITSLQSLELSELIKYINSKPLGGNEINILKSLSHINDEGDKIYSEEDIDSIRRKIKDNVFKDVKSIIDEFGMIDSTCEWRNSIAHNCCIEDNIFIKMSNDVKELTKKLEELCINIEKINTKDNSLKDMPNISTIVNTDKTKENILLRIIESYNNFFDNKLFSELINNNVTEIDDVVIFNGGGLRIIIYDINSEFQFENDFDGKMYKILIYFNEEKKDFPLNSELYKLLDDMTEVYIVTFDTISDMLCNKLYKSINHVENFVRLYIKISEVILSNDSEKKIDKKKIEKNRLKMQINLNALKINIDENKINLVNNDLYELDFIKLLDKLSSPLIEKNYSKLMDNKEYDNIDKFNKSIADLSGLDNNIESIGLKWKELYLIRTMVTHNFIISNEAFVQYKNLYIKASEEIEKAIYELIYNNIDNYDLSCKKTTKNKKLLQIDKLVDRHILKLVNNGDVELLCYIENNMIWNIINEVFCMNLNYDSIFFSKGIINELSQLEQKDLTTEKLENNIENVAKYFKLELNNKSNAYINLEKAISELLKDIAQKYDGKI